MTKNLSMSEVRNKLRDITIGAKQNFKTEIVEYDGEKFEIRQPTIQERMELTEKSTKTVDGVQSFSFLQFITYSVINHTYVPGTNDRVFDDTDYEGLVNLPTTSFMDVLGEAAARMNNVKPEEEIKKAKKPSKAAMKNS